MTTQQFTVKHCVEHDDEGRLLPAGGHASAAGIHISFQDGPLGRGENRKEPNGAFVETLIKISIDRLEFYNNMGFGCDENHDAIAYLNKALEVLNARTERREAQKVEGTHLGT